MNCTIHKFHSPIPKDIERHHIVPLSWGGPDIQENIVIVCPTGHTNIHELLREYQAADQRGEVLSWETLRTYGSSERHYAKLARDHQI